MLDKETIKKNFETKKYLHIDNRISFQKVKDYVCNSENIKTHSFLPFINYVDETEKFSGEANELLDNRPIKQN